MSMAGRAPVKPGETFYSDFSTVGKVEYECSADGIDGQRAKAIVEADGGGKPVDEIHMNFLDGSFELARGTAIDGWMVFEAPGGTKFRDFRWRAGDLITSLFN